MKKKLVAILLMFVIALLPLTVMAEGEEKPAPTYYRMNIYEASDKSGATSMDFMILDDKVYIHAEKLAEYLGYSFDQSYDECCFTKYDYNIAYMFFFDTTDVSIYMAGNMIDYNAPFSNKFINNVSWIPYNFACALFGVSAFCVDDGFVLINPGVSIFDVLSLVMSTTKPYKFDWTSEVGYTESTIKLLSGSAAVTLFLDGLFDGSTFTTFWYNRDAGIYNDKVIREIGDLFARPSEAEVNAYASINKEVTQVSSGIGNLIDITEVAKTGADAAKAASIGSYVVSEYQAGVAVKLWDKIEEIIDGPMSKSAFCSQYNLSYQMYEKFADASMVSGKVGSKMGKLEDIINVVDVKNVSVLDLIAWGSKIAGYAQNMAARDENTVKILQKYAADSDYGLASPLSNYANDMSGESGAFDATMEFLRRDLSTVVVDKLPLEKLLGGPGAVLAIGYNVASEFIPYAKNTLVSMENFQFAQYAIGFQNDSASYFEGEVNECFYDGKLAESELKDVCDYAFAFLKFSLVARSCGQLAVKNMEEVDNNTKTALQERMEAKNQEVAQYLAILSQAEDTNKNNVYGLLPSDCGNFFENTKEDEARAEKCIRIFGEKVESSSQTTVPDSRPNMSDAISEEEAIEIVRNIIGGFVDLDYLAYLFDGEVYTYDVVDTHKVIKDDGSDADTYVVAMYYGESLSALFFVTGDGDEVWMGGLQSDGDYYVMYQVNIKDFDIMELFYYLMEIEADLFENY